MIKAVIFDCFGVLTTDGWLAFRDKLFAHDPQLMAQAREANNRVDSGFYSYQDFYREIAQLSGVTALKVQNEVERHVANEALFDFIRDSLKPKYKIGMLSNVGADWLESMFTDWQIGLFDETALSFRTGLTKPDPRAYELIAAKLGVTPEECIFVDDQPHYCTVAEDLGMQAICFHDTTQTIAELEKLLHA